MNKAQADKLYIPSKPPQNNIPAARRLVKVVSDRSITYVRNDGQHFCTPEEWDAWVELTGAEAF